LRTRWYKLDDECAPHSLFSSILYVNMASSNSIDVSIDTRSLDEIYAAAQEETGPLIVASGGDAQAQWDSFRALFMKRFPEIKLELTVDFSKYHDSRADRAIAKGEHYADVIFLQALHDYPRWKHENRLLLYKPPNHRDIYPSHRDADGAYYGAAVWSFGKFLYDSRRLDAKDLPKSYANLLDPKWKGKLVLTLPNDDDAINYLFSIILNRYGWEWLEALNKQDVQWVRGTATPGYIIAEGNNAAKAQGKLRPREYAADNNSRVITFTTAGYPLEDEGLAWHNPEPPEQYMAWTQTAAIFKSTPRPETAKLFMAWITSEEFQTIMAGGKNPTLSMAVDRRNGVVPIDESENTQANGYALFTNNRPLVDWYKMQYETTLGTPQGVSPLDVYGFDDVRAL
jgi:ABC-type Fe3+ transport system substrate-binding protein